jgi:tRNA nucleotidyltransferase/poly(A) polymerase
VATLVRLDSVGDHGVDFVNTSTERVQTNLLRVGDVFGLALLPFGGNQSVLVGIHEQIECARVRKERKVADRHSDLSDDGGNLSLNFLD